MKDFHLRLLAASVALFMACAASAQNAGTVSNHAVPIGKGPGVTGFTSVVPGASGLPFVSNGASSDPSYQALGNSGLAAMPGLTIKCNPTGSSATTQDCTQSQAWTLLGGTSGHVFPLLDGANTWSQIQTLSLSNNSPLQLTGTSPSIEIGSTGGANLPSIDWHSSGANIDYDSRLVASGGNGLPASGLLTLAGSLGIAPTPGSLVKAFQITQTPSGTVGSSGLEANTITITDNVDAGGAFVDGIRYDYSFGGPAAKGGRQAVYTSLSLTAATSPTSGNRNYVAGTFSAGAAVSDGGTNLTTDARGAFFGLNPIGIAFSGATNLLEIAGGEVNYAIASGASATRKYGWSIVLLSSDAVQGSLYDCGLCLSSLSNTGPGMRDGILIGNMNGNWPISTTGTIMATTGPGTAAKGIDFTPTTFTGNAFSSTNFAVNSVGQITAPSFITNSNPGSAPAIYVGNSSLTIANGGNAVLSAGAGLVLIKNTANNHEALYLMGAASGVLVSAVGGEFVAPTTSPGAGFVSVAYNGTQYAVYNNIGSSTVFIVGAINTGGS